MGETEKTPGTGPIPGVSLRSEAGYSLMSTP